MKIVVVGGTGLVGSKLAVFKDYVRNIADWLHPDVRTGVGGVHMTHAALS
jgi:hypothetical protein